MDDPEMLKMLAFETHTQSARGSGRTLKAKQKPPTDESEGATKGVAQCGASDAALPPSQFVEDSHVAEQQTSSAAAAQTEEDSIPAGQPDPLRVFPEENLPSEVAACPIAADPRVLQPLSPGPSSGKASRSPPATVPSGPPATPTTVGSPRGPKPSSSPKVPAEASPPKGADDWCGSHRGVTFKTKPEPTPEQRTAAMAEVANAVRHGNRKPALREEAPEPMADPPPFAHGAIQTGHGEFENAELMEVREAKELLEDVGSGNKSITKMSVRQLWLAMDKKVNSGTDKGRICYMCFDRAVKKTSAGGEMPVEVRPAQYNII